MDRNCFLLVFAHRGEAISIMKAYGAQALNDRGLYRLDNDDYLLITGEGITDAIASLSYVLGKMKSTISGILNFGISGRLREEAKEENFEVRTVYAENEFKSFTLSNDSSIDIITSNKRVLNSQKASELMSFAPFVDRELWGYAYVANLLRIPLRSFKVVSDSPIDDKGDLAICEKVKEKSDIFSEQILKIYQKVENSRETNQTPIDSDENKDKFVKELEHILGLSLHLSFSQYNDFKKVLEKLSSREPDKNVSSFIKQEKVNEIKELKYRPKENARLVLLEFKKALNPFAAQTMQKIEQLNSLEKNKGLTVQIDPSFESRKIQLTFGINNERDKKTLSALIEQFPLDKYHSILDGEEDV